MTPQGPRPLPAGNPARGRGELAVARKPYELIPFPQQPPKLEHPAGHAKFHPDKLHGTLFLTLTVQTALHISTGHLALGSDVGVNGIRVLKTMTTTPDGRLKIQGSSLKGAIRAMYEAITNSTLAVITSRYKDRIPPERQPCRQKERLCPASRVFGALNWQGLVEFRDAIATGTGSGVGSLPPLYRPRPDQCKAYFKKENGKVIGRKFYYTHKKALQGHQKGTPTQQAAQNTVFKTQIHFKNLTPAELGTLFTVLGQDPNHPMLLKVGGGKPVGLGSLQVTLDKIEQPRNLKERYSRYDPPEADTLEGGRLQAFVQEQIRAAQGYILPEQLKRLAAILSPTALREPPTGVY
ncbi:RAMP superfamily CRISPR-associated protein [Synechococcus sp. JA-3-3Ab]|uniref:RAMP superfamily CRISPR-associated protein n=1 Tax=Synechococcus sp. (strain JA-3-3Ab) TaxID=321327 RepID=UPI00006941F5|nr:RAMP superfamily CRISPR-associated protein [Synechococcus sp. JA-3-3Ab]ABC99078.1 putative CRISPR-associated RAMP protein [Synechococcus sp. JA-3-3Ab]